MQIIQPYTSFYQIMRLISARNMNKHADMKYLGAEQKQYLFLQYLLQHPQIWRYSFQKIIIPRKLIKENRPLLIKLFEKASLPLQEIAQYKRQLDLLKHGIFFLKKHLNDYIIYVRRPQELSRSCITSNDEQPQAQYFWNSIQTLCTDYKNQKTLNQDHLIQYWSILSQIINETKWRQNVSKSMFYFKSIRFSSTNYSFQTTRISLYKNSRTSLSSRMQIKIQGSNKIRLAPLNVNQIMINQPSEQLFLIPLAQQLILRPSILIADKPEENILGLLKQNRRK